MKNTNEEYIQLPPLPRDTEGFVVQMFWEFMNFGNENPAHHTYSSKNEFIINL